jgi:alpha-D-ribose 1-methylphosphonate 5-triphosphate synthase subunit PhnI
VSQKIRSPRRAEAIASMAADEGLVFSHADNANGMIGL